MSSAGTQRFRLFKRKKGNGHVYYARLLDSQTGEVRRTVSTGETNKTRAATWTVQYLVQEAEQLQLEAQQERIRIEREAQVTIGELADEFWKPDAAYARRRRARGKRGCRRPSY